MRLFRPIWFVSLLVATGCGGGNDRVDRHLFRTEIGEDGVPISITSAAPKYESPILRFVEEVRLHQDEEVPESLLNRAYDYRQGPDGNYYVCDQGDARIVVYGPDGEYVRSIGRKGNGPAEFVYPVLESVSDRGVVVYNMNPKRVSRFSLDGEFIEVVTDPMGDIYINAMSLEPGLIITMRHTSIRSTDRSSRSHTEWIIRSTERDSLGVVRSGENYSPPLVELETGGIGEVIVAYDHRADVYYAPGRGFIEYDTKREDLHVHDLEGRLSRIIRLEWPVLPVTEADRQAIRAYYRRTAEESDNETSKAYFNALLEYMTFADTLPFFSKAQMDGSGYIWLWERPDYTKDDVSNGRRVMLLSPEGEYLGDAFLPAGAQAIGSGYLLINRGDPATGERVFISYRIESAVSGFVYP